jgi:carboxypeptidase C (cathepsin A)
LARRRLWSVGGDIDALAQAVRGWLDHSGRILSLKYVAGESDGGFRGPGLVQKLRSDEGIGVSGLILLPRSFVLDRIAGRLTDFRRGAQSTHRTPTAHPDAWS